MTDVRLGQRPESICLLRLSALGDVINSVPVVHALQRTWPQARITWVIGSAEQALVGDLPGVRFVVFDKRAGWRGLRDLRRRLRGERFDVLLQMQISLRANLAGAMIPAGLRLGYDRARSREGHSLFVNRRIQAPAGAHVVDTYFAFAQALGASQGDALDYSLPIPADARRFAQDALAGMQRVLLISPSSSHGLRNWRAERYAAVADHAAREYGYSIVLTGGPGTAERRMGDAIIAAMRAPAVNLIGTTSLKGVLALCERADVLLSPDSGPVHFANAVGTDVIGLYAASSAARAGPYRSQRWCVDRYAEAAQCFLGRDAATLRWGRKIERPGVMDLISVADVIERFEAWHQQHHGAVAAPAHVATNRE